MRFYIGMDNASGQEFFDKDAFLKELSLMIDDCAANGGTQFDVTVDADANCFAPPEDDGDDVVHITEEDVIEFDEESGNIVLNQAAIGKHSIGRYVYIIFDDSESEDPDVLTYRVIDKDEETGNLILEFID